MHGEWQAQRPLSRSCDDTVGMVRMTCFSPLPVGPQAARNVIKKQDRMKQDMITLSGNRDIDTPTIAAYVRSFAC
jgi:hypothetical protein